MRVLLIALVALSLSACATVRKLEAAGDVHALLISIRDSDERTFDALVDRPALKREIEKRLVARAAQQRDLGPLAAILAPGLAELAGESLIQPDVFRRVADYYGYTPRTKIPGPLAISQALRQLPDGRVCAARRQDGPCLLIFTKAADGHWKLSGFEGDTSMLRLKIG